MAHFSHRQFNYRHLHYFWAVAKEGHLTRVAQQLHVSQSALSAQIRQFEEQIGHDLFTREGRSLKLTEVGRIVFNYAENIFSLGREMMEAIGAGEGQQLQRLRVGAVATLSRNFQENFLRPVVDMEDVQLALESATLDELLARLSVHKLDLILSNKPINTDADQLWRCRRIAQQPVCLVGHPRPRNKPFRFPDDLANVKLLLPGFTSDIRTQFELLCEDLKIRFQIFAEVDDMALLRLLTRDSGGVALLPAVVVQDELESGVLAQYCTVPKVHENFYAITAKRQFTNPILERLLGEKKAARKGRPVKHH
ncbi:MAG: LysR substrate-binding domain-containing protein [Spongiibacteraceae bacterium]